MKKLNELSLAEASELLEKRKISSLDLVKDVLEKIDNDEKNIKAYLFVNKEGALRAAEQADRRAEKGERLSKIDGVPISVKDLLCTKGMRTTAASNILKEFIPSYNATVVQKLLNAGAIIIGKTNLDAFAHGSSTENSDFQITRNPWDLNRVPGGSSGGSAASVASNMCIASIGTDTGGSIRQPASLCGVVGLKPSYGRVSRYGVIAMASSLDVIGPITKTVEDAAIIMSIIAGEDRLDSTTIKLDNEPYDQSLSLKIRGLRVGVPEEYFAQGIDDDVRVVIEAAIDRIREAGAEIVPVSLPSTKYALSVYYIIQPAEVSSNLLRFDGIRYGYSALRENHDLSLDDVYSLSRGEGFGGEAKRRIMLGTYVLSAGYYDAYYKKALQIRTLVKSEFEKSFDKSSGGVDFIITPVSPTPAFKVGEKSQDPVQMYLSDIYTVPINPAGVPAISVPAGFVERDNKKLPVGMQIIAPFKEDRKLLKFSCEVERMLGMEDKPGATENEG